MLGVKCHPHSLHISFLPPRASSSGSLHFFLHSINCSSPPYITVAASHTHIFSNYLAARFVALSLLHLVCTNVCVLCTSFFHSCLAPMSISRFTLPLVVFFFFTGKPIGFIYERKSSRLWTRDMHTWPERWGTVGICRLLPQRLQEPGRL